MYGYMIVGEDLVGNETESSINNYIFLTSEYVDVEIVTFQPKCTALYFTGPNVTACAVISKAR